MPQDVLELTDEDIAKLRAKKAAEAAPPQAPVAAPTEYTDADLAAMKKSPPVAAAPASDDDKPWNNAMLHPSQGYIGQGAKDIGAGFRALVPRNLNTEAPPSREDKFAAGSQILGGVGKIATPVAIGAALGAAPELATSAMRAPGATAAGLGAVGAGTTIGGTVGNIIGRNVPQMWDAGPNEQEFYGNLLGTTGELAGGTIGGKFMQGMLHRPSAKPVSEAGLPDTEQPGFIRRMLQKTDAPDNTSVEQKLEQAHKPTNTAINYQGDAATAAREVNKSRQVINQERARRGEAPVSINNGEDELSMMAHAKERLWSVVQNILRNHADDSLDVSGAYQAGTQGITGATLYQDQGKIPQRIAGLERYKNARMTVPEVAEEIRKHNAELSNYYAQLPSGQAADLRTDPNTASSVAVRDYLSQVLNDHVEASHYGNDAYREANRRYGLVKAMEEVAQKRSVVAGRQAPQNIAEQFARISSYGDYGKAALRLLSGDFWGAGADVTSGVLKPEVAAYLKEKNSTDGLIKRAYAQLGDEINPEIAEPPKPYSVEQDPNTGTYYRKPVPKQSTNMASTYGGTPDDNINKHTGEVVPGKTGIHLDLSKLPNITGRPQIVPDPLGGAGGADAHAIGPSQRLISGSSLPLNVSGTTMTADDFGNAVRQAQGFPKKTTGGPNTQFTVKTGPGGTPQVTPTDQRPAATVARGLIGAPTPGEAPLNIAKAEGQYGTNYSGPDRPVVQPATNPRWRGMQKVSDALPPNAEAPYKYGRVTTTPASEPVVGPGSSAGLSANQPSSIRLGNPNEDELTEAEKAALPFELPKKPEPQVFNKQGQPRAEGGKWGARPPDVKESAQQFTKAFVEDTQYAKRAETLGDRADRLKVLQDKWTQDTQVPFEQLHPVQQNNLRQLWSKALTKQDWSAADQALMDEEKARATQWFASRPAPYKRTAAKPKK